MALRTTDLRYNQTLEDFVNEHMEEDFGYEYAYSEERIKELPEYDRSLENAASYTAVFGIDELGEYPVTLFVHSNDTYELFVGYEDGLGNSYHAEHHEFDDEKDVLNELVRVMNKTV